MKNELITHPEKIYWPEEKYTKEDLANYYKSISPYILPYLKDRPIVMHRFPEGISGDSFYQKQLTQHPEWIKTVPIQHEDKLINYLLINDQRSLLYAVNLGCIEIHCFTARQQHLNNPDYCVIDLDPEDISFDYVIEAAQAVHELLESISVEHFCKTSGATGLHIFIPLHAKYTFDQSRQFAEIIATTIHQQIPKFTSIERSPAKRQKKIYLDYLQNRIAQTMVAPYAVRPRPHAPVSTPLLWKEVKKGLDPKQFTIETIHERLSRVGDLFKPTLKTGVDLKRALSNLRKGP